MATILISGMNGNKLITQGYGSSITGGDSAPYYYMQRTQKKKPKELLIQIKNLLVTLKNS